MNSWLFRSLVALYPKAWRERYSKEVGDLSAELLAAGETTRTANYLRTDKVGSSRAGPLVAQGSSCRCAVELCSAGPDSRSPRS